MTNAHLARITSDMSNYRIIEYNCSEYTLIITANGNLKHTDNIFMCPVNIQHMFLQYIYLYSFSYTKQSTFIQEMCQMCYFAVRTRSSAFFTASQAPIIQNRIGPSLTQIHKSLKTHQVSNFSNQKIVQIFRFLVHLIQV